MRKDDEILDVLHKAADLFFDGAGILHQLPIDEKNSIAIQYDLDRAQPGSNLSELGQRRELGTASLSGSKRHTIPRS